VLNVDIWEHCIVLLAVTFYLLLGNIKRFTSKAIVKAIPEN